MTIVTELKLSGDNPHIIKAGEFKTHCLEIMDSVHDKKIEYIITKRGIPVAKLVPLRDESISPFGYMKDTLVYAEDIVEPLNIIWDAAQDDEENSA